MEELAVLVLANFMSCRIPFFLNLAVIQFSWPILQR